MTKESSLRVDYKKKYQTLKRRLRSLVYEQECFVDELKKSQRKLLKITRDRRFTCIHCCLLKNLLKSCECDPRNFLLDRLLRYEKPDESSNDSDATESNDSGPETMTKTSLGLPAEAQSVYKLGLNRANVMAHSSKSVSQVRRKPKTKRTSFKTKLPNNVGITDEQSGNDSFTSMTHPSSTPLVQPATLVTMPTVVTVSREEIERRLELKQRMKSQLIGFEKMSHSLPEDIFSHDNSNPDHEEVAISQTSYSQETEDSDLVIDLQ